MHKLDCKATTVARRRKPVRYVSYGNHLRYGSKYCRKFATFSIGKGKGNKFQNDKFVPAVKRYDPTCTGCQALLTT